VKNIERRFPREIPPSAPVSPQEGYTERLDVADMRLQYRLIERFFTKRYPGIPLNDPDARALAAREWIGDPNASTTYAARFRTYVEKMQQKYPNGYSIDMSDSTLDRLLEEIGFPAEVTH